MASRLESEKESDLDVGKLKLKFKNLVRKMIERKLVKTNNPEEQCQAISPNVGQCPYKKVEPSNFCQRHGANSVLQKIENNNLKNFKLDIWKNRVKEFSESGSVKSLREEIGILRLVLESVVNRCTDNHELILNAHKISDLVVKIEKLVVSCHRLENSMGSLLDKSTVINLSIQIVQIISQHVEDPVIVENIANEITQSFEKGLTSEPDSD